MTNEEKLEKRRELEAKWGEVWDTKQLTKRFVVTSFMAPYCFVIDNETGSCGSLRFIHSPRFYFDFTEG